MMRRCKARLQFQHAAVLRMRRSVVPLLMCAHGALPDLGHRPGVEGTAGRRGELLVHRPQHCDQVIASDNAVLLTPFVSLGLLPEAGSSLIAPRLLGHARAFSLLVMGKPLSATDARAAGIVNAVVPAAELDVQSLATARDIAALPPESVATARRLMRGSVEEVAARIDEEVEAFRIRLASPEAKAALAAFLNRKR